MVFREKGHQPELKNNATSVPMPLRPSTFPFGGTSSISVPLSPTPGCGLETAAQPQLQFWPRGLFTADSHVTDQLKDQELTIESGTISISSVYSQGLVFSNPCSFDFLWRSTVEFVFLLASCSMYMVLFGHTIS